MKKKLWILSFIMAIIFMMAGANSALAYTITSTFIQDASSVDIEPGDGGDPGMTNWLIGENSSASQLNLQWFWFKIGDTTVKLGDDFGNITPGIAVDDSETDELDITYTYNFGTVNDPQNLTIEANFGISGGLNPPTGHINEVINIFNQTGEAISLRLYEYNDFDLGADPEGDSAVAVSNTQIVQNDGPSMIAEVTRSVLGSSGSAYEIDEASDLLLSIIAGSTLPNQPALGTTVTGLDVDPTVDNIGWAFSWDFALGNDGFATLSKDKNVITPVPTALLLFGSGLFSLIGVGIRRKKS